MSRSLHRNDSALSFTQVDDSLGTAFDKTETAVEVFFDKSKYIKKVLKSIIYTFIRSMLLPEDRIFLVYDFYLRSEVEIVKIIRRIRIKYNYAQEQIEDYQESLKNSENLEEHQKLIDRFRLEKAVLYNQMKTLEEYITNVDILAKLDFIDTILKECVDEEIPEITVVK